MKRYWKQLTVFFSIFALLFTVACSNQGGEEAKKEITLAYVNWDSEVASTHVIKKILEDEGFTVNLKQVEAGPMWAGVASGSADAMVAGWLPVTHKNYYDKYKNKIEDLGPNLKGTKIGLVVPEYMDIESIEDLNKVKGDLDGKIIGIDAGAGIMQATEKAIKEYDLDLELVEGSSAAMAATLKKAIDDKKPVVVTGWTPHWKFAKYDLKFLEDPKKTYGGEENIHTIAVKGLKEDSPEAYKILDNFNWTTEDMEAVMLDIQDGKDPEKAAADWVKENSDKVKSWTK
ncbi:glycine betaine/proline transport system substrate-binding protein [Melghirimyces algeriensis]|uniref:Glycine betaine/proline transport system substrate-binding protein n=1 Tax=Melghirimyces algeriensis TaxID=910412 RepID=A0A521AEJ9_9BACL|nr:glycine betaine ABC transporter substrate-binding protein [Melghirimyces algeriensis]SMO33209.1 glycine betaine/proline transport system substrate-binding protein [Melghirimyces algeriensis]